MSWDESRKREVAAQQLLRWKITYNTPLLKYGLVPTSITMILPLSLTFQTFFRKKFEKLTFLMLNFFAWYRHCAFLISGVVAAVRWGGGRLVTHCGYCDSPALQSGQCYHLPPRTHRQHVSITELNRGGHTVSSFSSWANALQLLAYHVLRLSDTSSWSVGRVK